MLDKPLVSVLMTSYNRQEFIADAIDSVLKSSYTNFELIIVDDGSVDSTVNIARGFEEKDKRIRVYINQHNLGDYPNRNKAASYAKGKYIKYLDSDDRIYPFSLDIMISAMENSPEVVLGICYYGVQDDAKPFPIIFSPEEAYHHHFFRGGLLFTGPSGAIIRADYFGRVGGFSGKRFVSDTELWLTIAKDTPVLILQPALIWWRRHDNQEYNIGHVSEDYISLNYALNKKILESATCPLKEKERVEAIRNYKNRYARRIFKKITQMKFRDALSMIKASEMEVVDIVKGFIPINKIKRLLS